MSQLVSLPGRIGGAFSRPERVLLALLFIVACVAGGIAGYQYWLRDTVAVPAQGGTYTEGIVAASIVDIAPTLNVLTKVGFVRFDESGVIVPVAAERWEVSEDGKVYTFTMRPDMAVETIKSALADNEDVFPDIEVEVTDDRRVIFHLEQAFVPFLATTATPLFPFGPYSVVSQEKGIVKLEARPDSIVGRPYIDTIILRIYADSFSLTQALAAGDIDGVADVRNVENDILISRMSVWPIELPRRLYVFFNTEREVVKATDVRSRLRSGQALEKPIEVTLVTLASPKHEQLAQDLVASWEPLGVHMTLETRTATELAKEVIPARAYDILIYGLDFGGDPDPYPFWHSSQISEKGLNLSSFAQIDADRLLEKARQEQRPEEREKLYVQFQEIFDREVPAIELEQVVEEFATGPSVFGVSSHPGLSIANRYDTVAGWYLKEKRVRQVESQ